MRAKLQMPILHSKQHMDPHRIKQIRLQLRSKKMNMVIGRPYNNKKTNLLMILPLPIYLPDHIQRPPDTQSMSVGKVDQWVIHSSIRDKELKLRGCHVYRSDPLTTSSVLIRLMMTEKCRRKIQSGKGGRGPSQYGTCCRLAGLPYGGL